MGRDVDLVWGERSMQRIAGVDTHVEICRGPDDADERPVVAALHGFASGTFTWAGVVPALSQRVAVVAWDRPPFGRSGRPRPVTGPDDPYCLAADIERAVAVVTPMLDAEGVVLVGHSAGSLLAVQVTLADVLPVRAVVLLAPALDGAPPTVVRRLAGVRGAGSVAVPAVRVAMHGAAPVLRAVSRHPSPLIAATARETARLLRRPGTAAALWHLTATWQPPELLERLVPLGVPTLVIGGEDDRISSPASTEAVAERLDARLELLAGVGHAAQEQVPDRVASLIGAFVASLGR